MTLPPLLDVVRGLSYSDYWVTLAWNDIRARYRRSRIGQFWITISVGLFVIGIGIVYSGLMNVPLEQYMPRVTISYVVWLTISAALTGGCHTYIDASPIMQQRPFPFSVHAYRVVTREMIIFAHNALVVLGVWLYFGIGVNANTLLAIPGLALIAYASFWICIILGIASVRFRDIPPIVSSFVMLLFFITPVLWPTERLGGAADLVASFNPIAYLIAVVRDPLLGVAPDALTWIITIGICVILTGVGLFAMSVTRHRLTYWL